MAQTFPYGYSGKPQGMGTMLTWDQMMTKKTVYNLHPEVRRRFKALIEEAARHGVPLGCGTGWRVQPNPPPPGFAKPGNSWHESCPVSPQSPSAFAIDTVPNISWRWLGENCAAYGFRVFTNVNNEPWHIQPIDISVSRRYATVPPKIGPWDLPGEPTPPGGADMANMTVCSWGEGRLDLFVTGEDKRLWHRAYWQEWHPWEDLGGQLVGAPAATAWGPDRIDIFGTGLDGQVWQIGWQGADGWSAWHPHGDQP